MVKTVNHWKNIPKDVVESAFTGGFQDVIEQSAR